MNNHEIDSKKDSEGLINDGSSFDCDKCEQTFTSKQQLIEHGRDTHQLL